MGRRRKEFLYRRSTRSINIENWILVYFKEKNINLSELTNKLLKEYIMGENKEK